MVMFGRTFRKAAAMAILSGLLALGCAGQMEYKSPYSQQESDRTYRELYPGGFGLDKGPSATSSGDE
jgi:hypothetical protein